MTKEEFFEKTGQETVALISGGVLLNADTVGRGALQLPAVCDDEKQGRREPYGADNQAGKSNERHSGAQFRLGGMANGFPAEMDGRKLWKRESCGISSITEETENRALRLKTLGNAVCPPQVYPILKCIADIETGACKNNCVFDEFC